MAHDEWVGILNDEAATVKMAEIKANLPETWFAWSGPTTNGAAAYFRIQGPTLLIEYSPQWLRGSIGSYLVNALVPATSDVKISGQERDPLQREMRLRFHITPHVTPTDTHGPWPWTSMLILCLCLVLLLPPWKRLRRYLRRCNTEQIQAQ